MRESVDSNITTLSIAEEESLKTLPVNTRWFAQEPNSYSDFGATIETVARKVFNVGRQNKKGKVTNIDASGGFNTDITQNNMQRLLQGFFFADAREKASTDSFNRSKIDITSVSSADNTFSAVNGLDIFKEGDLVFCSGFSVQNNNGLKAIQAATTSAITTVDTLIDETPTSAAKITVVGYVADTGDINVSLYNYGISLDSTVLDFTSLGLTKGEWIFVGGDSVLNRFANNTGYARIYDIQENRLILEELTWNPVQETGTGLSIQLFFGTVIRNENTFNLIKRRSYHIERTLGQDEDGTQTEYLVGAIPNELTVNIPQADKLNADLTFVAMDNLQYTGDVGLKAGERIAPVNEDAFNTSSDIYSLKMSVIDNLTKQPKQLFAYVTEATLTITNNVTPNKAVTVLGAFDATAGNFDVTGSITAYFNNVEAVKAVRNNSDVAFNVIFAQNNAGFVYDIPLISLGGGVLNVEQDSAITIPVDMNGAECEHGYTMLTNFFAYLPTIAIPTVF